MPVPETPKSGSVSCGITAPFSLVLVCIRFCWCPRRVSVFLVLWNFYNLTFKVKYPGDSQSLCQIPRLGSLLWGPELSHQCENFFGIIVLQLVSRLPSSAMVGLMATSFKMSLASTATLSATDPAAGHCQPTPPWEIPGHSQASQSVVGSLLLSPGSW